MADVFISHSSEDRERVRALAGALEEKGISVWWDRAAAGGDDYAGAIEKARDEARAVIVVWSERSVASPFVVDEAERARKAHRLISVALDDAVLPAPFKPALSEDFRAWRGDVKSPEVEHLAAHVRTRLAGAPPQVIDRLRSSIRAHIRLAWAIGAAVVFAVLVLVFFLVLENGERASQDAASEARFSNLVERARAGTLNGEQAIALADFLQRQALGAAAAEAARESFAGAAAQLLQDPDADLRDAAIQAVAPRSREAALNKLWEAAGANGRSSGALYRYIGALGVNGRTREALERAREADPADRQIWRMLAAVYAEAGETGAAEGAARVGDGLEADAEERDDAARALLESALPRLRAAEAQAFVQGRLGDIAAKRDDWVTAEARYRQAVELRETLGDEGALAIETSKLARAQLQQDRPQAACATLQRAARAGVETAAAQIERVCGVR